MSGGSGRAPSPRYGMEGLPVSDMGPYSVIVLPGRLAVLYSKVRRAGNRYRPQRATALRAYFHTPVLGPLASVELLSFRSLAPYFGTLSSWIGITASLPAPIDHGLVSGLPPTEQEPRDAAAGLSDFCVSTLYSC